MKRVAGILALISVLGGSAAMADPHFGGAHGHGGGESAHQGWHQDGRWNQRNDHRQAAHRESYRDEHARYERGHYFARYDGRYPGRYDGRYEGRYERPYERPYGRYNFRRGDRLPVAYYGRPYVIADYRGCGLYAPPRGYRWVRVDGNAVLAAVATGIVLDAVYHAF